VGIPGGGGNEADDERKADALFPYLEWYILIFK